MNKLFQFITSHKKISTLAGIVLLSVAIPTTYTVASIYQNVQKIAAEVPETTTYFPDYPQVNTTGHEVAAIKHGEVLVKTGDCIACHTNTPNKDKSKPFAGGLPMETPFGTIYTTNITPDKETGIGNWTFDQFKQAMREGISPKGHYYYPAFPYLYFNKISDADLQDIKAYLDSIPAVHQENRKNEMIFPFNFRIFQLGWRMLFFYPNNKGPYQDNPKQTALWNHGAYLAEGLGHCAMCHSPCYHIVFDDLPLAAPVHKYEFTGAKVQGFLAPDISKRNLTNIAQDEVVEVFTKDKLIGGGKVEGPMLEVNHDSLGYLSHDDLLALVTYLKSVESESPPKPTGDKLGKSLYVAYCSGCHQSGGGGAPKYADAADWDPIVKKGMEAIYKNAIVGLNGMPAKGTCLSCTDDDIKKAVDYMLASVKGKSVVVIPKVKHLTLADGQRIYKKNCSACHDGGSKNAPKVGDTAAWDPIVNAGFIAAYENVLYGKNGHPAKKDFADCSKPEIIAAIEYMMQSSSVNKDYSLW